MGFIVPPGGIAGFNQMTSASKRALGGKGKATGGKRRRKKRKGATGRKRKSTRKRKSSGKSRTTGQRMKFGSPAWQKKYKVGAHAPKRRGPPE